MRERRAGGRERGRERRREGEREGERETEGEKQGRERDRSLREGSLTSWLSAKRRLTCIEMRRTWNRKIVLYCNYIILQYIILYYIIIYGNAAVRKASIIAHQQIRRWFVCVCVHVCV
jgi:hypothetical protein